MGQDDSRSLLHQILITIRNTLRSEDKLDPDSQGKGNHGHGAIREGGNQRIRAEPSNQTRGEPPGDPSFYVKQQLKQRK